MYCPYYKEELRFKNGELYYRVGNSCFSKHIENACNEKIDNSKKAKVLISTDKNSKEGHFLAV